MGVAPGDQSLKAPQSETCRAFGSSNTKGTSTVRGVGAGAGFADGTAAADFTSVCEGTGAAAVAGVATGGGVALATTFDFGASGDAALLTVKTGGLSSGAAIGGAALATGTGVTGATLAAAAGFAAGAGAGAGRDPTTAAFSTRSAEAREFGTLGASDTGFWAAGVAGVIDAAFCFDFFDIAC